VEEKTLRGLKVLKSKVKSQRVDVARFILHFDVGRSMLDVRGRGSAVSGQREEGRGRKEKGRGRKEKGSGEEAREEEEKMLRGREIGGPGGARPTFAALREK